MPSKVLEFRGVVKPDLHPSIFGDDVARGSRPWGYRVLTSEGEQVWLENTDQRTFSSLVFDSPDGKHHITEVQNWRNYKAGGRSSEGPYLTVDLADPDNLKAQFVLTRLTDGIGYTYQSREPNAPSITVRLEDHNGKGEVRDDKVYYADVAPDLDIYTQAWPTRYGVFKVLKGPKAPTSFEFLVTWSKPPVNVKSLRGTFTAQDLQQAKDGLLDITDIEFPECIMPARLAWDGDGKPVEVKLLARYDKAAKAVRLTEQVVLPENPVWPITVDTDVTEQVGAGADDGYADGTYWFIDQTDVRFGSWGSGDGARLFARWNSVAVDQGATIDSGYISYKAKYDRSGVATDSTIWFNDAADAASPTSAATYDGKAVTTASVRWQPGNWTANSWYNTPSITAILQEIVDIATWASGNDMMVLHKKTPGVTNYAVHIPYAYESAAASAPKLVFSWSSGYTPPTVETDAATSVDHDSAQLNGELTSLGDDATVDVYFQWREDGSGTWDNSTAAQEKSSTGTFNATISSLDASTDYEFRAVVEGTQTVYGDTLEFTTTAAPVDVTITAPAAYLSVFGVVPVVSIVTNVTITAPSAVLFVVPLAPSLTVGVGQTVAAPPAAFTLLAVAPVVSSAVNLAAPAAHLTIHGIAPTITAGQGQTVTAPAGYLTLHGAIPTIAAGSAVTAPPAYLSAFGVAPVLSSAVNLAAPVGYFTLHTVAPSLASGATITAPGGLLSLHTLPPSITAGTGQTVTAPPAYLSLFANAPSLSSGVNLTSPTAHFSAFGAVPSITTGTGQTITAPSGYLTLHTLPPTLATGAGVAAPAAYFSAFAPAPSLVVGAGASVEAPAGLLSLFGAAPVISSGVTVTSPPAWFSLYGVVPTVEIGGNVTILAPAAYLTAFAALPSIAAGVDISSPSGYLTLHGVVPSLSASANVVAPSGYLSVFGAVPAVSAAATVTAPPAHLTFGVAAPGLSSGVDIATPPAYLTLHGAIPSLVVGTGQTVTAPSGYLSLHGVTPSLSSGVSLSSPAGYLTLIGAAPSTATGAGVNAPAAYFTLYGSMPSITAGQGVTLAIPAAYLGLFANVPSLVVGQGATIAPPAGLLTLHGATPAVSAAATIEPPAGYLPLLPSPVPYIMLDYIVVNAPAAYLTLYPLGGVLETPWLPSPIYVMRVRPASQYPLRQDVGVWKSSRIRPSAWYPRQREIE